jgi:adenosylcobinamide-GDP ribazoletransferase
VKTILVAAAFLTRLPIPVAASADSVGLAARWFPLVGAAIGGACALLAWVMREALGFPPMLAATLLVAFSAWVTGAIHLDGLADTADGFGGGQTRDDVLRIMRDPLLGTFGTTALAILLATKAAALTALLQRNAAFGFLVAAPAISRWTPSVLAAWLPYARTAGGLGQVMMPHRLGGLAVATSLAALISIAVIRTHAWLAMASALLIAAWLGNVARRRIDGVTGDVFGASVELTETAVLLVAVFVTRHA